MAPKQYHAPRREEFPDALSGGEGRESPSSRIGERERQSPKVESVDPSRNEPVPGGAAAGPDMASEDRPQALERPEDAVKDTAEEKLGLHPIGASAGAVGGAVLGAAIGMAAGPLGSLAGAVGGALLGSGLGASGAGAQSPMVDTSAYDAYWRDNYAGRPYVASDANYDDYEPAYRYGAQAYARSDRHREWDEVEPGLRAGWEDARGRSTLRWEEARHAVHDAWNKMTEGLGGAVPEDKAPEERG